jgi:GxxExxY protein
MELNTITAAIVDSAMRIHSSIGPGLLESVYETLLARDLARRGFHIERQKSISFTFEGIHFEAAGVVI